MLTCKETHRLVSEKLDRSLSWHERVGVRMHLLICGACRNFNGQMHLIRDAMRKMKVSGADEDKGKGGRQ